MISVVFSHYWVLVRLSGNVTLLRLEQSGVTMTPALTTTPWLVTAVPVCLQGWADWGGRREEVLKGCVSSLPQYSLPLARGDGRPGGGA